MYKVNFCPTGAHLRGGVEQSDTLLGQVLAECLNVGGAQAHLLQAGAFFINEFSDGGVLVERGQQLDHAVGFLQVLRADHGLGHTLLFVGFLMMVHPPESAAVKLDCGIQIRDCDTHMVQANN